MQPPLRNLIRVGILTWFLVGIMHVTWAVRTGFLFTPLGALWLACFIGFIVLFWFATQTWCAGRLERLLIGAQVVLALVCIALQPDGFLPILLVILAGQLGHLGTRAALAWIAVQTSIYGAIEWGFRGNDAIGITIAYFTFQLFGAFTARIAYEEREAKQALAEANAELRVATGLLDMSSRAEERLRIARDLHDLIGHHLTALSLNLEVASHLAEGAAREQIEKSQSLTKLLLSDVRDVVSRLRDAEPVDLSAALRSLRDVVSSPAIEIDATDVTITDPAIAQTVLRAVQEIVTNAVRHSGAKNLRLTLTTRDHTLSLDARDDGSGVDRVTFGNGLRGMRERVEQTGGTIEVASQRGHGFEVRVRLPLEPNRVPLRGEGS